MNLIGKPWLFNCKNQFQKLFLLVIASAIFSCNSGKKLVVVDPAIAKYIQ